MSDPGGSEVWTDLDSLLRKEKAETGANPVCTEGVGEGIEAQRGDAGDQEPDCSGLPFEDLLSELLGSWSEDSASSMQTAPDGEEQVEVPLSSLMARLMEDPQPPDSDSKPEWGATAGDSPDSNDAIASLGALRQSLMEPAGNTEEEDSPERHGVETDIVEQQAIGDWEIAAKPNEERPESQPEMGDQALEAALIELEPEPEPEPQPAALSFALVESESQPESQPEMRDQALEAAVNELEVEPEPEPAALSFEQVESESQPESQPEMRDQALEAALNELELEPEPEPAALSFEQVEPESQPEMGDQTLEVALNDLEVEPAPEPQPAALSFALVEPESQPEMGDQALEAALDELELEPEPEPQPAALSFEQVEPASQPEMGDQAPAADSESPKGTGYDQYLIGSEEERFGGATPLWTDELFNDLLRINAEQAQSVTSPDTRAGAGFHKSPDVEDETSGGWEILASLPAPSPPSFSETMLFEPPLPPDSVFNWPVMEQRHAPADPANEAVTFEEAEAGAETESDDALRRLVGQLLAEMAASAAPAQLTPSMEAAVERATERFLSFSLAGEVYAVALAGILETDRLPRITRVPGLPAWAIGVSNLRGAILPVVDLRRLLSLEEAENPQDGRILVVRPTPSDSPAVVVVDRLEGVALLAPNELHPAPAWLDSKVLPYLEGIGSFKGRLVNVLDLGRLFEATGVTGDDSPRVAEVV